MTWTVYNISNNRQNDFKNKLPTDKWSETERRSLSGVQSSIESVRLPDSDEVAFELSALINKRYD